MYFQANRRYSLVVCRSGFHSGVSSLFDLTDRNQSIEVEGRIETTELGHNVHMFTFEAKTEKGINGDKPLAFTILVDMGGGNVLYLDDNDEVCSTPITKTDLGNSNGPLEMVQFDTHRPEWESLGVYWQFARNRENGQRIAVIMQNIHLLRASHN